MPGLFQGIGTMNSALRAFQRALDVTGHNVANVNTPGYNRQGIQFNPVPGTLDGNVFIGNGVSASSVFRIQDQFLYARQIQASSEDGRLNSLNGSLNSIQGLINEPGGSSIGDAMNQLFNAWSALGSSPNDAALRQQVQTAGATLASRVRGMYAGLQSQSQQTGLQIKGTISQAQGLINQIADLNQQIRATADPGSPPNDLMDQRDQAVQQLSQILPVTVQPQNNGTVALFSGQMTLVDQSGGKTLPTTYDSAAGTLIDGTLTYPIPSGQLAGLFQTTQKISGYEQQLDTLANSIRTQFNSIHATGTNALGNTGVNFFADVAPGNPQTGAIDFDLDPAVKANAQAIATGVSGSSGDGGLALSLSALRDAQITTLGGKTFSGYFSDFVTSVGQDASSAQSAVDTSTAVLQQIGQQIQSVSGVSLDDEMGNLLRFQRSYQAAAKALSVFDQTTDDLINILH